MNIIVGDLFYPARTTDFQLDILSIHINPPMISLPH